MEHSGSENKNPSSTQSDARSSVPYVTASSYDPHKELHRLLTFPENWSTMCPMSKESLASNGYFYKGPQDTTQCVFCRLIIKDWEANDTPESEHRRWNPSCPFINGRQVGNIKLGEEKLLEKVSCDEPLWLSSIICNYTGKMPKLM